MVVSMQVLHLKLEPPSFLNVRRKRDMNLLAHAIAPSCEASNLAISGQDTSIAVGPDKRTAEVPSSPRFETRKANLHDVSTAQPQGRRGPRFSSSFGRRRFLQAKCCIRIGREAL